LELKVILTNSVEAAEDPFMDHPRPAPGAWALTLWFDAHILQIDLLVLSIVLSKHLMTLDW